MVKLNHNIQKNMYTPKHSAGKLNAMSQNKNVLKSNKSSKDTVNPLNRGRKTPKAQQQSLKKQEFVKNNFK